MRSAGSVLNAIQGDLIQKICSNGQCYDGAFAIILWQMLLDLDLEAKLRADLESARERFLKRTAELDLVVATARAEASREEAWPRIQKLRNEQRIAIAEFECALRRYVEYVLDRKIADNC
jgi:hypothetical protein